jgi:hypothetical protein
MHRFHQTLLIFSTFAFSWLAMMAVHELGHIINGSLSGGRISRVVLHPLVFSRTDFSENPHSLFTAWGGGLWGIAIPLIVWAVFRRYFKRCAFLAAFFLGFCSIANGAYLAGGSFFPAGGDDAGVILQHGGAVWQLLLFGIPAVAAGLWFWNGLGPHFGFGQAHGIVDRSATWGMMGLLISAILLEIAICG